MTRSTHPPLLLTFLLIFLFMMNKVNSFRKITQFYIDSLKGLNIPSSSWSRTFSSMSIEDFQEPEQKSESPVISWYPGHIAKAERELSDYLKKVDVVIEVRDARIPLATTHPMVPTWVGNKPLIIAVARLDQVSKNALTDWREFYAMNAPHPERPDAKVYFIDGKLGTGVLSLKREALKAGIAVNERRVRRGIQPRAVRAAVIGFPNVGKSALINRLLGRKMAKSRNLPGVTRSLQWVRIGGSEGSQEDMLELLDSPGIIPARQFDQRSALKLAICNDIGEASYDRVVVAAAMCNELNRLYKEEKSYIKMKAIQERYEIPFTDLTGEEIVYEIAELNYKGNLISASDKLLGDFRKGFLGYGSLETPRDVSLFYGEDFKSKLSRGTKKPKPAVEIPTIVEEKKVIQSEDPIDIIDVGRGNYEGW